MKVPGNCPSRGKSSADAHLPRCSKHALRPPSLGFVSTLPVGGCPFAFCAENFCAKTTKGVVYCWGRADSGQLGIGTAWVHETPSGVMGVEWPRRVRGSLEGRRTVSAQDEEATGRR